LKNLINFIVIQKYKIVDYTIKDMLESEFDDKNKKQDSVQNP
jgi:hypothetical protein